MTPAEMLALLPWRAPFLMIDRLVECTPHEEIVTCKLVTCDDPLASAPDGGAARFPASLLIEGMSQSAALLFRISRPGEARDALPMLGWMEASLRGSAQAGDAVWFHVQSLKMTARGGVFRASARVGGDVVAEAELAFAGVPARPGAGRTEDGCG